MAPKSDKEPKASKGSTPLKNAGAAKATDKAKKPLEDDDILDDETESLPVSKKSLKSSPLNKAEEDDEDSITPEEEVADEWEKTENDDDEWDPDFDEFDVPKSKSGKKITGTRKVQMKKRTLK